MPSAVPPMIANDEAAASAAQPLMTGCILVVDDDPVVRDAVARILQMEDYQVLEATDVQAALDSARGERPGLTIVDVSVPTLDGFAVCRELRADPSLAGMRILGLSGRGEPADAEQAMRCGADACLTKPFSSLGLVEVVRQLAGE
jgi:two-component system, OmpR family, alkaline phosphatase synthesis response regulator PhoP